MSEPIVVIDRSEIREGKLEELKAAVKELIRGKAEMLGNAAVVVHDHQAGFDRFGDPIPPA